MKLDIEVCCSYCITAYGFRRMIPDAREEWVCVPPAVIGSNQKLIIGML
jgi:hypothetical protein